MQQPGPLSGAPLVGVDDELRHLTVCRRVGVCIGRWGDGGEASYGRTLERHPLASFPRSRDRLQPRGFELVSGKVVEHLDGHDAGIRLAPGAHLDVGDRSRVVRPRDAHADIGGRFAHPGDCVRPPAVVGP